MAKIADLNEAAWGEWVSTRPPAIQAMCAQWPPDRLYRMTDTGHCCTLLSYSEDGTVTVSVSGEYNATMFDREVFGVDPHKLEECDLPGADEPLGTVLTEDADVERYIELIRPMVLAERDADQTGDKP
jgi:hypothetical protein